MSLQNGRLQSLTEKKYSKKTRRSHTGKFFIGAFILCTTVAIAVGLGMNVLPAGAGNTTSNTFGLTETSELSETSLSDTSDNGVGESNVLTKTSNRNIDQAIDEMVAIEQEEASKAEEARLAAEAAKQAELNALQTRAEADAAAAGVSAVDWTLGHEGFVSHWAVRIDAYLAGSPLAGQGATFAEAAWQYGVDPRLSPAISNTESSKGAKCFLPYNAWGWGQSSWGSWEQAINGHVMGLATEGYGPMITFEGAQRYCPPHYAAWYKNTIAQVALI